MSTYYIISGGFQKVGQNESLGLPTRIEKRNDGFADHANFKGITGQHFYTTYAWDRDLETLVEVTENYLGASFAYLVVEPDQDQERTSFNSLTGSELKRFRQSRGMTQKQFADYLGVRREKTISEYENEQVQVPDWVVKRIAAEM